MVLLTGWVCPFQPWGRCNDGLVPCRALCRPDGDGKSVIARSYIRTLLGNEQMNVSSPSFLLDNAYQTKTGDEM